MVERGAILVANAFGATGADPFVDGAHQLVRGGPGVELWHCQRDLLCLWYRYSIRLELTGVKEIAVEPQPVMEYLIDTKYYTATAGLHVLSDPSKGGLWDGGTVGWRASTSRFYPLSSMVIPWESW